MAINYNSVSEISGLLKKYGLHMSKKFGQNFLLDERQRSAIIDTLDVKPGERVWEIGPGIGALTYGLLQLPVDVTVFEIDRGFISILKNEFCSYKNFNIVEGDFLKTWESSWAEAPPDRIIGNLPYSVGSVIIAALVKSDIMCSRMVFTLQKEVVERITAVSGSKAFSGFSLICQYKWRCTKKGMVPRNAFFPVPDVTSAYMTMDYVGKNENVSRNLYDKFVNDIFLSRRKTIRNNIKNGILKNIIPSEAILEACVQNGVSPGARGEELTVDEVVKICGVLQERYSMR